MVRSLFKLKLVEKNNFRSNGYLVIYQHCHIDWIISLSLFEKRVVKIQLLWINERSGFYLLYGSVLIGCTEAHDTKFYLSYSQNLSCPNVINLIR